MRFEAPTSVSLKKMYITSSQPSIYMIPTYLQFPPMDSTTDYVVLWYLCSVTQSCLTLCIPMDCSLPGSSGHRIFQERILGWVVICLSRGSSWLRDWILVSDITTEPAGKFPHIRKYPHVSEPTPFWPILFKGQMCKLWYVLWGRKGGYERWLQGRQFRWEGMKKGLSGGSDI